MTSKIYALLVMIFTLAGTAAAIAYMILVPGRDLAPCLTVLVIFPIYFAIALILEINRIRNQIRHKRKKEPWNIFEPDPISVEAKSQKNWELILITYFGVGLFAIVLCGTINTFAGLAAIAVFGVGLFVIYKINKMREAGLAERRKNHPVKYGDETPVEFLSYRFFEESFSKTAEILSNSRVSGLPFNMPYYEKIDRLAQDGSCAIFSSGTGMDRILTGVQSVIARRGLDAPRISKEAVTAGDSEQIRNRRRDGEDTNVDDLNRIGRILDEAGLVLLDLLFHPYQGQIITVITPPELERLKTLNYIDLEEYLQYRK